MTRLATLSLSSVTFTLYLFSYLFIYPKKGNIYCLLIKKIMKTTSVDVCTQGRDRKYHSLFCKQQQNQRHVKAAPFILSWTVLIGTNTHSTSNIMYKCFLLIMFSDSLFRPVWHVIIVFTGKLVYVQIGLLCAILDILI